MEIINIFFHLLGLIFLMVCSAFFSGTETAFSALTKTQIQRLRHDKKKTSQFVIHFIDEPRKFFITVLFGNILVNIAFVTITGSLIYHQFFQGRNPALASACAVTVELIVLLIFGEITPKTYAMHHAEALSRIASYPLILFSNIIYPFRKILRLLINTLLSLFGVHDSTERLKVTGDDLKTMFKIAEEEGVLDEQETEVIKNILDLCVIDAKEAMTPRTDMSCVEVSTTIQEAYELAKKVGHSRLPVYRKDLDNICGIFYVKDLPRWQGEKIDKDNDTRIEAMSIDDFLLNRTIIDTLLPSNENTLVRQPLFAYEGKKIAPLMRKMTGNRKHLTILLDEYGGVSGLITIEDIVEEVVGEISDEYDLLDNNAIVPVPEEPDTYRAPARVNLRSVNRKLKLKLDKSSVDTLGGYVIRLFDKIPAEGNVVFDKQHNVSFEVTEMDRTRIKHIKIKLTKPRLNSKGTTSMLIPLGISLTSTTLLTAFALQVTASGNSVFVIIFSLVLIFSLTLIAFFAGSETAVISANKEHIKALAEEGNSHAAIISRLLGAPDKFLAMVLVGTNLMTVIAGQAGVMLTNYIIPGNIGLQKLMNTAVMTTIILVFCEILPKTIFHAKADTLALRSASMLRISDVLLRPIVVIITKITTIITGSFREKDKQEKIRVSRDELHLLATMGGKEGSLPPDQIRMIQNVLNSEIRTIEKVMVPLINIAVLPKSATQKEFFLKVAETGFSRIAIYEERVDNLIGFVHMLDVLYSDASPSDIYGFIRKNVSFEPETREALSLLKQLQKTRNPMAFVVDEYGGVIGLVTLEDLVEEIVGEIVDERDIDDAKHIYKISENILECDGSAEIHELNHRFGTEIPAGNYETIAGFILSLIQRIPKQGEYIETDFLRIMIIDADSKRIRKVRIHKAHK